MKKRNAPVRTGRVTHQIQLDIRKPLEKKLDEVIPKLKEQRKFAGMVRSGLELALDLEDHSIEVLLEKHPWIVEKVLAMAGQGMTVVTSSSSTPPQIDNTDLIKEIKQEIRDEIRSAMLELPSIPDTSDLYPKMKSTNLSIAPMPESKFSQLKSSEDIIANFLNSFND